MKFISLAWTFKEKLSQSYISLKKKKKQTWQISDFCHILFLKLGTQNEPQKCMGLNTYYHCGDCKNSRKGEDFFTSDIRI
jgi:hypothetical protein